MALKANVQDEHEETTSAMQWCKQEQVYPLTKLFFASLNILLESTDQPLMPQEAVFEAQSAWVKQLLCSVLEQTKDTSSSTIAFFILLLAGK